MFLAMPVFPSVSCLFLHRTSLCIFLFPAAILLSSLTPTFGQCSTRTTSAQYTFASTSTNLNSAGSSTTPLRSTKNRKWAQVVDGKWQLVSGSQRDPRTQVRTNPKSATYYATSSKGTCCHYKCRSLTVTKKKLRRDPYRSIVRIQLYTENYVAYCSGSLIGPRVVLTAKHCLEDTMSERIMGGFVTALYGAPGVPTVRINIQKWRWFNNCKGKTAPDYAVLKLQNNLNAPTLKLATTLASSTRRQVVVMGFPRIPGREFGRMQVDSRMVGTIRADSDNSITLQLIYNSGGSGSPVYSPNFGILAVGSLGIQYLRACGAAVDELAGPVVFGPVFSVKALMANL